MFLNRSILLLYFILQWSMAVAQQSQFNFRHLGATQGLADGVVRAIGQDKYGYIWISTLSGLNRFDGYTVRTFYNDSKDSTSIPAHTVRSIFCDRKGRLWLGCNRRLVQFDYATAKFHYVPGTSELGIFKIVQHRSGLLYLHTNQGLVQFDPESLSLKLIKVNGNGEEKGFINDMYLHGDQIYLATKEGLSSYHVLSHQRLLLYRPSVENKSIDLVVKDGRGHFWWTQENRSVLIQSDSTFKKVKTFSAFQHSHTGNVEGAILNLFIDQKKELWFTTNINGLVKYDYANAALRFHRSNPYINTSLSTNHVTEIFQSQRGFIWIGTEGLGVHYFHPTGNFIRNLVLPDA
ncbi:MAG TPA: two-component regulator propeller domain-containing protein, partial [Flavisolibacter sp.]|nr:two-component regulator propeller domain-containing protein [Flavisolibacter sp.]